MIGGQLFRNRIFNAPTGLAIEPERYSVGYYERKAIGGAAMVCIGDGCCAMVSGLLGQGRADKARRAFGNAIVLTMLASAVLTAVYLLFGTTLVALFGGRATCRKSDWAYASRKHEQRQQKGEYAM